MIITHFLTQVWQKLSLMFSNY